MSSSSRRRYTLAVGVALMLLLVGAIVTSAAREDGFPGRHGEAADTVTPESASSGGTRRKRVATGRAPDRPGATPVDSPSEPDPERSAALLVRVTDAANDAPIPGADVTPGIGDVTTTNGDGLARIAVPATSPLVVVHVRAAGFARPRSRAARVVPGGEREVAFELVRAGTLRLLFVDGVTQEPVANVHVDMRQGAGSGVRGSPPLDVAATGPDGTLAFSTAPIGETVTLLASARGYAPTETVLDLSPGDTDVRRVELTPAKALSGRVVDTEGDGVPRATVRVVPASDAALLERARTSGRFMGKPAWLEVMAKTDGSFRLVGLIPDTTYVAFATDRRGSVGPTHGPFVAQPPLDDTELVLPSPGSLTIVLRGGHEAEDADREQGMVHIRSGRQGLSADSDTFRDGESITFSRLPAGEYEVWARSQGLMARARTVCVQPGRHTELDVELEEGLTLAGRVLDDRGAPVPSVRLNVAQAGSDVRARTDHAGRFRLAGLTEEEVEVESADRRYAMERTAVRPSAGDVVLRCIRVAAVTALAEVPSDTPPRFIARIERFVGEGDPRRSTSPDDWRSVLLAPREVEGEAQLRRFTGTSYGPSRVRVELRGFAPVIHHFDAPAGGQVDLGTLTFEAGRRIAVRTLDEDGAPLEGVRLSVFGRHRAKSDALGAATLSAMADGTTRITGSLRGYTDGEVHATVGPGAPVATLTLLPHRRLRVVVTGPDGAVRIDRTPTYVRLDGDADSAPRPLGLTADNLGFTADVAAGRYRIATEGADTVEIDASAPEPEPAILELR